MQAFFTPLAVKPGPRRRGRARSRRAGREEPPDRRADPAPAARATAPGHGRPAGTTPGGAGRLADRRRRTRTSPATWPTAYWAHFLGRGLVEPVDDVRDTNPPSNPELLDALATLLVESRFDARALIRAITGSRDLPAVVASRTRPTRATSRTTRGRCSGGSTPRCCSTWSARRPASPRSSPGVPGGHRAVQLWDSKVPHYFLRLFGRPRAGHGLRVRAQRRAGRRPGAAPAQPPELHAKLTHEGGTVARLVRRLPDDAAAGRGALPDVLQPVPDRRGARGGRGPPGARPGRAAGRRPRIWPGA